MSLLVLERVNVSDWSEVHPTARWMHSARHALLPSSLPLLVTVGLLVRRMRVPFAICTTVI